MAPSHKIPRTWWLELENVRVVKGGLKITPELKKYHPSSFGSLMDMDRVRYVRIPPKLYWDFATQL